MKEILDALVALNAKVDVINAKVDALSAKVSVLGGWSTPADLEQIKVDLGHVTCAVINTQTLLTE